MQMMTDMYDKTWSSLRLAIPKVEQFGVGLSREGFFCDGLSCIFRRRIEVSWRDREEYRMDALQLSDDVIAGLTDEQMTILQDLGELAAKKLKVSRAIDDFTAEIVASQKQMGFQTKAEPSGLHEDPELLALLTIKERYKMGNIREQIRRTLRRALEVGLGKLAVIQRQCKIYGVDPNAPERRFYSDPAPKAS
jgi:hypothetical protein